MIPGRFAVACALAAAVSALAAQADRPVERAQAKASPRLDHAVGYYDARLGRVVVVGDAGDPTDGDRDRVWSWTGAEWELISSSGPPGRVNAGAAYDRSRARAVVAGGARKSADGAAWTVVGDSWVADAREWKAVDDIAPRDHLSLVDTPDGVLMFGGIPAVRSSSWPNDTWVLREGTWVRDEVDGPGGRGRTAMAYDRARKQVVLFGGVSAPAGADGAQTFLADTWIWNGTRWRKAADEGPRGRYAHGMVFDERRNVVLVYSGAAAHKGAPLADMWQWDGVSWSEIPLNGPTPGHRYQPVMVYDPARGRTVLYGGLGGPGDTWEWDGARWHRAAL